MDNPLVPIVLSILRKLLATLAGMLFGWGLLESPLSPDVIASVALFLFTTGWGLWTSHKDTVTAWFARRFSHGD